MLHKTNKDKGLLASILAISSHIVPNDEFVDVDKHLMAEWPDFDAFRVSDTGLFGVLSRLPFIGARGGRIASK